MAVERVPHDGCFGLLLCGRYEPFGAVDDAGEAVRGRRTAHVRAPDVLRVIVRYIEKARAHNQAALAGHRPLKHIVLGSALVGPATGAEARFVGGKSR
jgi:hypothetical protein